MSVCNLASDVATVLAFHEVTGWRAGEVTKKTMENFTLIFPAQEGEDGTAEEITESVRDKLKEAEYGVT